MISIERNIRFYRIRGQIHLGVLRVLFGVHRGAEGAYLYVRPALWVDRVITALASSCDCREGEAGRGGVVVGADRLP